jgi:hypothetical protein
MPQPPRGGRGVVLPEQAALEGIHVQIVRLLSHLACAWDE